MVHWYPKYTPVGARRAWAAVEMNELRERGVTVQPVEVRDRNIVRSFWGRRWCEHLESFSDYANRLPPGRTYVRNGSVCHLAVEPGRVEAMVAGRELYRVVVRIRRLERPAWKAIRKACAGQIGSVSELLQGRLSDRAMDVVAHRDTGLFPQPGEIELTCDCPDRATVCKHAAAVLYGVGSRLDDSPELLFRLRGVDEAELVAADMALPGGTASADTLADGGLGDIFDIDLDPAGSAPAPNAGKPEPGTGPGGAAVSPPRNGRKPTASAEPAGAAVPPPRNGRKPTASAEPAGAAVPPPRNGRKPTASAEPAGAADTLAPASLKPAASPGAAGAAAAPAANSLKPAASPGPAGAAGAPAANSLKPVASTAPAPRKPKTAPRHRPPRADPPPALPRRQDAAATVPRFRPTGALIAELRKRCGFSVAEFAELLQVSGTTVRRWEAASGPLDLHARSREALMVLRREIDKRPE